MDRRLEGADARVSWLLLLRGGGGLMVLCAALRSAVVTAVPVLSTFSALDQQPRRVSSMPALLLYHRAYIGSFDICGVIIYGVRSKWLICDALRTCLICSRKQASSGP